MILFKPETAAIDSASLVWNQFYGKQWGNVFLFWNKRVVPQNQFNFCYRKPPAFCPIDRRTLTREKVRDVSSSRRKYFILYFKSGKARTSRSSVKHMLVIEAMVCNLWNIHSFSPFSTLCPHSKGKVKDSKGLFYGRKILKSRLFYSMCPRSGRSWIHSVEFPTLNNAHILLRMIYV